jgi:hypothetical protein
MLATPEVIVKDLLTVSITRAVAYVTAAASGGG